MFSVFTALLFKVIPLYVNLLLGFVAGRWLGVDRHSVATLMIYIISPVVFFGGMTKMALTPVLLTVPLLGYAIAMCVAYPTYFFAKKIYQDDRANIMAPAAGTGNNGYFGLPIAMMLFDEQTVGIYLMLVIGVTMYESSLGFYLTAKGQHTARESFLKTLKLPTLYAMAAGCAISLAGISMPDAFHEFIGYFKGAYAVLGMMIIGLGLSGMKRLEIDFGFCGILFFARFVVWPALALAIVYLDRIYFGLYSEPVHLALTLISFMPLAANAVAIASLLRCHPEKTATAVLLSTVFAAIYVPIMVSLLLQ